MASSSNFSLLSLALFGTRGPALGDQFCHVRFDALRFRLLPTGTAPTALAVMGFLGGVQDISPANLQAISEVIPTACLGTRQTVPSEWCNAKAQDLKGPMPWYKSVAGGADTTEEAPGYVVFVAGATDVLTYEMYVDVTVKTAVATGNTPMELSLHAELRALRLEKERLLAREKLVSVLEVTPPAASGGGGGPGRLESKKLVPAGAGCGMPYLIPSLCKVTGCPYHQKP